MIGRGTTTLPSPATAIPGGGGELRAIRWLFPVLNGRITLIDKARLLLGRDETADVALPGTQTSRIHAELAVEGAIVRLRDLNSRNGVFVDGKRIKEAVLSPNCLVRVGEWLGVFTVLDPETYEVHGPAYRELQPGYFVGPTLAAAIEPLPRAARSGLPKDRTIGTSEALDRVLGKGQVTLQ